MKEFNTIIGENQARKENLQGEYERQVMDVVLNGRTGDLWGDIDEDSQSKLENMHNDLVEWKTKLEESKANGDEEGAALASANIEALFETAQAMGKSLFDNSEFMRALGEVERDEIAMIRENTAGLVDIVQNIYLKTQELSKGLGSSYLTHLPDGTGLTYLPDGNVLTYLPDGNVLTNQPDSASQGALPDGDKSKSAAKAHAYGLRRVPFDGYPALLHEGERVLTKSEAEHALAEDGPRLGADAEGSLLDALTSDRGDIYDAGRWGRRPLHDTGEYPPLRWAVGGPRSAGSGGESQDAAPGGGGAQRPGDAAAGGLHIAITGNDFVGTGEEMADQIMEVLIRKLEQAYTAAGR